LETREGEAHFRQGDEAVFLAFHFASERRSAIIVTEQVQDSMDGVADEFFWPGGAKFSRLRDGDFGANEDFTGEGIRYGARRSSPLRLIKGNDVGGANVIEVTLIDAGHFFGPDEMKAEFVFLGAKVMFECGAQNAAQESKIDRAGSLAVAQAQGHLARCSS
jgi:hypothetical protein